MPGRELHGESVHAGNTPEYRALRGAISRCHSQANKDYHRYGGRGIVVCDAWRKSYPQFLADVGRRPSPRHSLDRFPDTNGNYESGNVRWATPEQQARNRRGNRLLAFEGRIMTVSAWAQEKGLHKACIRDRLNMGWSIADALTVPSGAMPRKERAHGPDGRIIGIAS